MDGQCVQRKQEELSLGQRECTQRRQEICFPSRCFRIKIMTLQLATMDFFSLYSQI